ncbi:beta-ketoacyl-ACP reductase [Chlamydia muridarum str. Nigg]|jgi:3-oxoacyl-(acyl-carrier-protein) reductase|uniref:3-oxoacyl-[acyl-carrier-protein] reductase FabG n=2 Tax=Chlamydia muridarum TaxID=83560 RepID=FABG_CHLMU|nr:3-oxoacyl-ACP reductase FabG [Chlamydia muridarum]Q9PKF7.1 RecName: Full=3-oxoacyl-[acyl-carrier-protein] reductase FabG; AltName: Full=3-ketoacyl-acyl carrier protein reductase; AltName: Full=Beta-Ketoacyl-acyl carrier protein reductase; AltName: Full=Beta-ketoacyl-ACP reductase [Chlamydia muridarum str. Nigg]UFW99764.1 3-oxoacyl-ACP reductase FabG [Chlamydia trachomatis]AAF39350.1 3-oxoacyl-(acyl carrier protein) reductase [Chlamydia muridarum str. Nigg]AHH22897.1 3-ketoacyl-ACP reductase 
MNSLLVNKAAIVTGGSRGIGFGIAKLFAEHGANVQIWGINEEAGKSAAQDLSDKTGSKVSFALVDVSKNDMVSAQVQKFLAEYGTIDVVVNNAGITRDSLLMRMSEEEWSSVIDTNLGSIYNVCSAVIRPMIKARSGAIVNISSIVGLRGSPGQTNYAAAKAGIIGFSKALSKEVGSKNIRVNCIAPGFIDTDMTKGLSDNLKNEWLKGVPLGRVGTPEEIAMAALFLASNQSSYITGQVLSVDGGMA